MPLDAGVREWKRCPRGMSQRTAAPAGSIARAKKSGWSAGPRCVGVIDANTQNAGHGAADQPPSAVRCPVRAACDGSLGGVRQRVAQAVEVRREIAHASPQ